VFRVWRAGRPAVVLVLMLQAAAGVRAGGRQDSGETLRGLTGMLLGGRYGEAATLIDAAERNLTDSCLVAVARARLALEKHDWLVAMAVPADACANADDEYLWYARGIAAARAVGRSERLGALPAAQQAAAHLRLLAEERGPRSRAEVYRLAVAAAIAASQDERDEMRVLLTHGSSLDARLYDEQQIDPRGAFLELAGDLWLQVDRYGEARAAYTAALTAEPRRARSMLGLARVAAKESDRPSAERAYRRFLESWDTADDDRPEISEAREYLSQTSPDPAPLFSRDGGPVGKD
jgi:hypothetical protein